MCIRDSADILYALLGGQIFCNQIHCQPPRFLSVFVVTAEIADFCKPYGIFKYSSKIQFVEKSGALNRNYGQSSLKAESYHQESAKFVDFFARAWHISKPVHISRQILCLSCNIAKRRMVREANHCVLALPNSLHQVCSASGEGTWCL